MRLRQFAISNYRSIRKTPRIDISNSLTIIGPNNEGKSNLVRALVSALSALEHVGQNRSARQALIRFRSRSTLDYEWERDCHIGVKNDASSTSRFYLEFELDEVDQKDFFDNIGSRINSYLPIEVSIGADNVPSFDVKKQGKAQKLYKKKTVDIARFIGERLSINHIPAIRTAEEAEEIVRRLISTAMRPVTKDPEYIKAIEIINSVQEPVLRRLGLDLTKSLGQFLPSVKAVSLEFPPQALRRTFSAVDIQIDDGQLTALENKGDGVISLVSMALLARLKDSTGSSFNTILAIEEPESHLHPRAIHAIREVLSGIGNDYQVITTTHSPLLANRSNVAANVIVKENNAQVAESVEQIRDALGVRVSDNLSHARVVLICEGSGDELFLRKALREMSQLLDSGMISGELGIYSLDGVGNLPYAVSMLQQSVSSPICFLDNDQAARDSSSKIVADGTVEEHEITFSKVPGLDEAELEDLYDKQEVRKLILNLFKVDIESVQKGDRKRKFSERCARAFSNAGKDFGKLTKIKVKSEIARMASERGIALVPEEKRGPLVTLVAEIESLLVERA